MASASQRPKVVVVDPGYRDYDVERRILAPFDADIVLADCEGDADAVAQAVRDADAVLLRESPLTEAAIEEMSRCRAIVRYGVGVDNIDLEAARRRRIPVANVPDYGAEEVSDHALALLLAVVRRVAKRDRDLRAGAWDVGQSEPIYRIRGRVLGLVGYGRIARHFHRKTGGLGIARTLVFDPVLEDIEAEDVRQVTLDVLCRESDFISLHAPLTEETGHLIDETRLRLMKPEAVIINTARGALVDEAALARALAEGRLFGAGLDVFEREPPRPDNPLLGLDNVVLSDHGGWYSEDSVHELQAMAAEEVVRVFSGDRPKSWVNEWDS